ncbi:MAG: hypothetical protein KDC88_16295 [Ignavibacteriae bacterium]|nr:hypothetical protein [Ignavibacteriota bacterium]MCB9205901.1 hypothetical protein [Ignavibacteriales bacterium]MCB9210745.1 hypothetical protein [Ignavibacteriales bacterium]
MFKSRIKYGLIFLAFFISENNYAQNNEQLYKVNTTLSFGYSYFATAISSRRLNRFQPNASFKIMWKPEHLLSIGLEGGYVKLYTLEKEGFTSTDFGITNVNVDMSAVPLFMAFSMEILENININGGIGGFLLLTNVEAFDNLVTSTGWSTGYNFGVDYKIEYSNHLNFGSEIKCYYISKVESVSIGLNLFIQYALVKY